VGNIQRSASQLVGTGQSIGPQTITAGDLGICQSYTLVNGYPAPSGCTLAGHEPAPVSACSASD